MDIVAIAAVVIALTFIVLVGFLIPALTEIRKTAFTIRKSMSDLDQQLKPVLKDLHELTSDLRTFVDGVTSRTDEVKSFMTALGDIGRSVSRINVVVGDVAGMLNRSALLMTGVKAAGQYFLQRITYKRG
jgi:uncharacterized protein YoxC